MDPINVRGSDDERLSKLRIVWLDLETTGLDPLTDLPIEAGVIITDGALREVARRDWLIVTERARLEAMPSIVLEMHRDSGLLAALEGPEVVPLPEVDVQIAAFLDQHGVTKASPLAGNSVGDFDRHFLRRRFPATHGKVSHRSINVSTFKALIGMWDPALTAPKVERKKDHRAVLDCEAAIDELIYWCGVSELGLPGFSAVMRLSHHYAR